MKLMVMTEPRALPSVNAADTLISYGFKVTGPYTTDELLGEDDIPIDAWVLKAEGYTWQYRKLKKKENLEEQIWRGNKMVIM